MQAMLPIPGTLSKDAAIEPFTAIERVTAIGPAN
jgi:hypothetical protein